MVSSLSVCGSTQAGNVVTGEMVEELILSGADIIKVGIGPGTPVSPAVPRETPLFCRIRVYNS